jgi:hypothetical protein
VKSKDLIATILGSLLGLGLLTVLWQKATTPEPARPAAAAPEKKDADGPAKKRLLPWKCG